ncbi:MAG TPA: AAA family ATPase [Thermotogota bacterium]|nr:AAA family ATPase [Thermotogota bacterium]
MTQKKESALTPGRGNGRDIIAQEPEKTLIFLLLQLPGLFDVIRPVKKVFPPALHAAFDVAATANQDKAISYLANAPKELLDAYFAVTNAFWDNHPELFRREDDAELTRILANVHRRLLIENRDRLDPDILAAEFARSFTPFAPTIITHGELRKVDSNERFVLYPYIPAGAFVILAGDGGTGKTYLALDIARAVANNETFCGMKTTPGKVLIVDEESGLPRLKERMARIEHYHDPIPDDNVFYCSYSGFCFSRPQSLTALKQLISDRKITLCMIDALVDVIEGDENSAQDVTPVMRGLREITSETGAAIVLIHHTNKVGGYRGSSALKGAVDVLLIATQEKLTPNGAVVKIKADKMRDGHATAKRLNLNWDAEGFTVTPYNPVDEMKDKLREDEWTILTALRAGRKKIDEIVVATGLSKNTIHSRLRFALKDLVDKHKSGQEQAYYYELSANCLESLSEADFNDE